MPHTNKASAPVSVDIPEFEGRYVDLGGYTVGEARAHALAEELIKFLETSEVPNGLFAADIGIPAACAGMAGPGHAGRLAALTRRHSVTADLTPFG